MAGIGPEWMAGLTYEEDGDLGSHCDGCDGCLDKVRVASMSDEKTVIGKGQKEAQSEEWAKVIYRLLHMPPSRSSRTSQLNCL